MSNQEKTELLRYLAVSSINSNDITKSEKASLDELVNAGYVSKIYVDGANEYGLSIKGQDFLDCFLEEKPTDIILFD